MSSEAGQWELTNNASHGWRLQARGNFASQADQNLALKLCGGDSVRTVQMQTYVTSASAVAQFASNQLVGRWCAFNLKKIG